MLERLVVPFEHPSGFYGCTKSVPRHLRHRMSTCYLFNLVEHSFLFLSFFKIWFALILIAKELLKYIGSFFKILVRHSWKLVDGLSRTDFTLYWDSFNILLYGPHVLPPQKIEGVTNEIANKPANEFLKVFQKSVNIFPQLIILIRCVTSLRCVSNISETGFSSLSSHLSDMSFDDMSHGSGGHVFYLTSVISIQEVFLCANEPFAHLGHKGAFEGGVISFFFLQKLSDSLRLL